MPTVWGPAEPGTSYFDPFDDNPLIPPVSSQHIDLLVEYDVFSSRVNGVCDRPVGDQSPIGRPGSQHLPRVGVGKLLSVGTIGSHHIELLQAIIRYGRRDYHDKVFGWMPLGLEVDVGTSRLRQQPMNLRLVEAYQEHTAHRTRAIKPNIKSQRI